MNRKYLVVFVIILAFFGVSIEHVVSCLDGSQFLLTLIATLSMPYSCIIFVIDGVCFSVLLILVVCNTVGISAGCTRITGSGLKKKILWKRTNERED